MEAEGAKYPGELASPQQVRELANEYRGAADHLLTLRRKGKPLSMAPFRFTAIHAIELYLNAFLLHAGHSPAEVRGLRHDLAKRTGLAEQNRLRLRQRTVTHLNAVAESREYIAMRYAPEMMAVSQINRLSASLTEVATKVTAALEQVQEPTQKPE